MQALECKKFVAYFDESFPEGPKTKLVDESFFSEENGYRPPEIRSIREMEPYEVRKITTGHGVWRVR